MGDGKTNLMVALGQLARDSLLRTKVVPEIARDAAFGDTRLVAVEGRSGFEEMFVWGEIAKQLGKGAQFSKFWRDGAKAPSEKDWTDLIGDDPTLILLDELPPYFDYAVTRIVGNGNLAQVTTYALSNLLSASLKLKRCCIVISNLSGSYSCRTAGSRAVRSAPANARDRRGDAIEDESLQAVPFGQLFHCNQIAHFHVLLLVNIGSYQDITSGQPRHQANDSVP